MKKIKLPALQLSSVSAFFAGLHRRERTAITIAGIAVILFCLVQFIIFPLLDRKESLQHKISAQQTELKEIQTLKSDYEAMSKINHQAEAQLKNRPKNFSLFSYLDGLAGKSGIKKNIVYMKPSTTNLKNSPYALSIVELKLQTLTMKQVLTFLHGIEMSGQQVWIQRMSLTRDDKTDGLLNSIIQAETYQL